MTLPASKDMRRPLMDFLLDKNAHSLDETIRHLAGRFDLTEKDKNVRTPDGRPLFSNRVIRTVSAFRISGLLENESLGKFKITDEGVRASRGSDGDLHKAVGGKESPTPQNEPQPDPDDHSEGMRLHAHLLNEDLKSDLITHIFQCSPAAFEVLVIKLLVKMGYGELVKDADKVVGGLGDHGIDGIIKEDELGLGKIYVQAKRWQGNVGDPEVQKFLGALSTERSERGVFITTGGFTQQALERCKKSPKLVLIDGNALVGYMIRYGLGVRVTETHEVKEIDTRFFSDVCGLEAA